MLKGVNVSLMDICDFLLLFIARYPIKNGFISVTNHIKDQ